MVFQCKNYSEITVETRTQLKSVIFTTDIFAVYCSNQHALKQEIHQKDAPEYFLTHCALLSIVALSDIF